MKPIIGILARPTNGTNKKMNGVYKSISDMLYQKGAIPIGIVAPSLQTLTQEEENTLYETIQLCDGLLAEGGDDFYDYDIKALSYTHQNQIPTLGICLGMQAMACLKNGIKQKMKPTSIHHQTNIDYVHEVEIEKDSKLYEIIKIKNIIVNSRHQEEIIKTDLTISAKALDGTIEAVEDKDHPFFIGVEWHPEDLFTYDTIESELLNRFIEACKE